MNDAVSTRLPNYLNVVHSLKCSEDSVHCELIYVSLEPTGKLKEWYVWSYRVLKEYNSVVDQRGNI